MRRLLGAGESVHLEGSHPAGQRHPNSGGSDLIRFAIPGNEVRTIKPNSELPTITEAVTIDGFTQPGASVNTLERGTNAVLKIQLNGADAAGRGNGLTIQTSNVVVRGLVINSFDFHGISMFGSGEIQNDKIEGNFIGTDPSGLVDLGNEQTGVFVNGGGDNIIGGSSPEARNVISGNGRGIEVFGEGGNEIQGNLIGTKKDGAAALGNNSEGVLIAGSSNNALGGAERGAANTIAFNGGDGVRIVSFSGTNLEEATGNRILRNSIFSNGGLGIDLAKENLSGPTANDPGDTDTGPNNLQNKPAITSALTSGGSTTINGKLNSTFVIRFFSNPSGNEGKVFRGQKSVSTNSNGDVSFSFSPATAVPAGQTITATSSGGDTSEFSAPRTVVRP